MKNLFLTFALSLSLFSHQSYAEVGSEKQRVKIGVILPMSGATAVWGEDP